MYSLISNKGVYNEAVRKEFVKVISDIKSEENKLLTEMKNRMEQYIEINPGFGTVRIQFDFNPMNIF